MKPSKSQLENNESRPEDRIIEDRIIEDRIIEDRIIEEVGSIDSYDTLLFRIYESYHYQNTGVSSYKNSSIKNPEKTETLSPKALQEMIARRQLDLSKYWNAFSLSTSEHTRIFSNQVHPDDAILLWNYILVNFFRLKVFNEQGHFIDEYVQLQKAKNDKNISKNIENTYFWKIESAALQFSLEGNFELYLTKSFRTSVSEPETILEKQKRLETEPEKELEKGLEKGLKKELKKGLEKGLEKQDVLYQCDREMDLIQRLGLLYRAIYVLIVQDGIFASILRSEQLEMVPKSRERIPAHQKMLSQWTKEIGGTIKERDAWSDNGLIHQKFFALCFLVSFSQVQGMWKTLFIGQKIYFSETKAQYFRQQFDMFSDNVSAILGDTMMSFSSILEEKSIFDPKLSKQYLKVFRSLYQMIQYENPVFLSFHPLLQPSVIAPTTVFDIKNICSQTEGWNNGILLEQDTRLFNKINSQNKNIEENALSVHPTLHNKYRYEEENWLHSLQKISIYRTMSEPFADFFEELIPMDLFGDIEKNSIFARDTISEKIIDSREPDREFSLTGTFLEDTCIEANKTNKTETNKIETNKTKNPKTEKFALHVLLEKAKQDVFRLYRWNAWSKISDYSIGTFLQPYLFERSVKAEATSQNQVITLLPCHVVSSSQDLEVSLIIYQHRLLLQILGDILDVQVRMGHDILYSFDIPIEYKEFDFLWYELPKDPPDKIVISYQLKISNQEKAMSKEDQQFNNDRKRELVLHF